MATPTTVLTSEFGEDLQYRRRDSARLVFAGACFSRRVFLPKACVDRLLYLDAYVISWSDVGRIGLNPPSEVSEVSYDVRAAERLTDNITLVLL